MAKKDTGFLTYRGKPFVRNGNIIYYGDLADPCVVMLQILDTVSDGDRQVAGRVSMALMLTDESVKASDRILKKSEKQGLYNAMDLASIWLERTLKELAAGGAKADS